MATSKTHTQCPWIVRPPASGTVLEEWAQGRREQIAALLLQHKAILFRGFGSRGGLETISSAFFEERLSYTYRSTPRTELGRNVYTATEYPKHLSIPQHCENAYHRSWPMKLLFHCVQPAAKGGCTPLADIERVTETIDPAVRQEFERRKVRYVRNYRVGMDLPWEEVFGTRNRQEVESFCTANGIACEWTRDGLRTSQVCQALATHPRTGQRLWFNQAHLFHVSSLDKAAQELMLSAFGAGGLPRNAFYGDGAPIPPDVLDHIRVAYETHMVRFDWQEGDVLLLDNMLMSHGRDPFEGDRKVLVCMAEAHVGAEAPQAA